MNYQGFYINLERNPERRSALEAELSKYQAGSRYQRFPAVDGQACGISSEHLRPGEVGVFLSHVNLLQQQAARPGNLHIIEDDVRFSEYTLDLIDMVVDKGVLNKYDLLFLDVFVPIEFDTIRLYKEIYDLCTTRTAIGDRQFKDFQIVDLARRNFASAASYLVNRDAIGKILETCRRHLDAGPTIPYDLVLRNAVRDGTLKAGCLFPFVTSVDPDSVAHMDIPDRYADNLSPLVAFLLRYSFFVGCDWPRCLSLLPADCILQNEDEHRMVILSAINFKLFGNYQKF